MKNSVQGRPARRSRDVLRETERGSVYLAVHQDSELFALMAAAPERPCIERMFFFGNHLLLSSEGHLHSIVVFNLARLTFVLRHTFLNDRTHKIFRTFQKRTGFAPLSVRLIQSPFVVYQSKNGEPDPELILFFTMVTLNQPSQHDTPL